MSNTTTALLINSLLDSSAESARATAAINESARLTEHNSLLQQGQRMSEKITQLAQEDAMNLQRKLAAANAALAEARSTCKEWEATMDAWKGLAIALRDEIKECPNEEAHHFGRSKEARDKLLLTKQEEKRIALGLKPR